MRCTVCGIEGIRTLRTTKSYGKGENSFLIEQVPVHSCPHCGESYLTAETLLKIEHIRQHWREMTVERNIAVAIYEDAY